MGLANPQSLTSKEVSRSLTFPEQPADALMQKNQQRGQKKNPRGTATCELWKDQNQKNCINPNQKLGGAHGQAPAEERKGVTDQLGGQGLLKSPSYET